LKPRSIILICISLCLFSVVSFAQAKPAPTPEAPQPKPLTQEQLKAVSDAEKQIQLAQAQLAAAQQAYRALMAELALAQGVTLDKYEFKLVQLADGVWGFKPRELKEEKK